MFKININLVIGHTMLPNFYQATKKSPEWYLNGLQNNYILKTYGRNSKCLEGCEESIVEGLGEDFELEVMRKNSKERI